MTSRIEEEALRAAAVAAFVNAQDLRDEAKLLTEQKRYPRATALAVVGADAIGYPQTPVGWLADLFSALCGWGLASLLDSKRADRHYREMRERHTRENKVLAGLRGDPDRDIFLEIREPDLKNAALYVDLTPSGAVQSPDGRVGSRAADTSILGLEYFLRKYRPIPEVLDDDALWGDLAADVRTRVGVAGSG